MPPWEKYQQQQSAPAEGPWSKYQAADPSAMPAVQAPQELSPSNDPTKNINAGKMAPPFYIDEMPMGDPRLAMPGEPPYATQTVVPPTPFRPSKVGWQGAGAGLADLAGTPVDLTAGVLNLGRAGVEKGINLFRDEPVDLGRFEKPVGGSQWIRDLASQGADAVGIETVPEADMSFGERLLYNVNRIGTGAVATGGALARGGAAATKSIPIAPDVAISPIKPSTPVLGPMSQPYREAAEKSATMPGPVRSGIEAAKPLIADTAAGASAGAALTGSQEFAPDSPIADMAAMLLGGTIGGVGASGFRSPGIIGRNLYERHFRAPEVAPDPITGKSTSIRTTDQAARFAQSRASDPEAAAENIGRVTNEARLQGEPEPTTGIASGDIGMIAGERGARLKDPVPFQERDQALKDAAEERVTGLRDPYAEPRAAQRFVEQDVEAQLEAAKRPVTEAESRLTAAEEAEQALGGQVQARRGDEVTASERLAESVGQTKQADTARKSGLYREAETLGRSTRVGTETLEADAAAIRSEIGPLAAQDQSLNNVLRDLETLSTREGGAVGLTATDLIQMRPRLSRARDAASKLMRGDTVERLDRVNDGIKAQLDSLAEKGDAAALKWQEAEANFREDFAPKYREGVGAQMDKAERAGTPVPPTRVAGRFLGGGKEAAENLNTILRNSASKAEGDAAARDFVLADMSAVVDKNGKINVHALRNWIGNREGLFQAMPNLREEANQMLQDAVNRRGATTVLEKELKTATEKLKRTETDIQKSATSLLLDTDPLIAAKRVFSHRDPETAMKEIVGKLKGDKEAAAGWKRAVSEHMIDRVTNTNTAVSVGSDGPVSIAGLQKFFKANERVLAAVYSPEEMQSLRRAHKILEPLGNLSRQVTAGSPTIENQAMWNGVEAGLLAVTGNAITTGMIMKRIRTVLKFLPDPEKQLQHLTTRMYFEPELAQHLLTRNVKEVGSSGWNAKLTRLLAVSEGARELNDDED